jgi:hypothetical protein
MLPLTDMSNCFVCASHPQCVRVALTGLVAHRQYSVNGCIFVTEPGAVVDNVLGYVPQKLDLERGVPLTGFDFLRAPG